MGNEITIKKQNISALIASNGMRTLAQDFKLTNRQIGKANSSALAAVDNPIFKSCSQASLLKHFYTVARYDFSRDDCCYPVPYGDKVQTQISYQGFRELAMRTGKYSKIDVAIVKDCDTITRNEEGEPEVDFCKDYFQAEDAKTIGYFAYAKDMNGKIVKSLLWSVAKCEKHGKRWSKAYGSIWGKAETFDRMAMKTVLKQLLKDLDTSELTQQAVIDDQKVMSSDSNFKEKDTYADNPMNTEIFDATNQVEEPKKTTVKNTLSKPKPVVEEKKTEEPKQEEQATIFNENYDEVDSFFDNNIEDER